MVLNDLLRFSQDVPLCTSGGRLCFAREHILLAKRAQLVALELTVHHFFELADLELYFLVVRVQLVCRVHHSDRVVVLLSRLVQQSNVDQHINFIKVLLCLLGLLQGFFEKVESICHLARVLRQEDTHVVVGEERLLVYLQGRLVTALSLLGLALPFLDDSQVVVDAHFVVESRFQIV